MATMKGRTMVKVGDTFMADYHDGRYQWSVEEVIDGRVVLATSANASAEWGIGQKAWTVEDVETSMKLERAWDRIRQGNDDFWSSIELGSTIHYHNGFGEYVRGRVISFNGKKLLEPVALVGNWTHHWEYQWAKLLRGDGAWQPSSSCVYESPSFVGPRGPFADFDPTTAEPLDFSGRESDYLDHLLSLPADS